jgi:hypothetical protein
MISRRELIRATGAIGLAAALSLTGSTALPRPPSTLLRASPNPRGDNLSCDIAEKLCDPSRLASVPDRYQLELDAFRTVSPNALQCLSEGDWLFADFGLSDVSESMARALSEIQLACADFYHVQTIPPAAIATLLAGGWDGLAFNDVVAISPDAVRELADRMVAIPEAERGWLSIRGNFHVSLELARIFHERRSAEQP